MSNTRNVPVRSFGFRPDQLMEMQKRAEQAEQEPREFSKYPFYIAPDGLELFEPAVGVYTFDILQFKLSIPYHPYLAKEYRMYDLPEDTFWYDREISTHQVFKDYKIEHACKRTYGTAYDAKTKTRCNDAVCEALWNDRSLPYNKVNKNYVLFLIRMHPNATLGNKDYKFMYFLATSGIFSNVLREEIAAMRATNDMDNMGFYMWDNTGKSIKARFVEQTKDLPVADGTTKTIKWIGCNKIDFIDRKQQLTDADVDFIMSLDMDAGIEKYNDEGMHKIADIITGKASHQEVERTAVPETVKEEPANNDAFNPDDAVDEVFGKQEDEIPMGNDSAKIDW